MIFDDINNAGAYFGISPNLDKALMFALFMPGELHAPKLSYSTPSDVRKVVVKVLSL